MTIYELCISKAHIYELLRNEELEAGNDGNARRWAVEMESARNYARSLPIEIASFDLTEDCPFRE